MPYTTAQYIEEKEQGERRPNGIKPLRQLKVWHRTAIALHAAGVPGKDIASFVGKGQPTVSLVLSDPKSQAVLTKYRDMAKHDLYALYRKSLDTLDEVLTDGSPSLKLRATKQVLEQFEKEGHSEGGSQTAEDVIAEIFRRSDSVTINLKPNQHPIKTITPQEVEYARPDRSTD